MNFIEPFPPYLFLLGVSAIFVFIKPLQPSIDAIDWSQVPVTPVEKQVHGASVQQLFSFRQIKAAAPGSVMSRLRSNDRCSALS